MNQMTNRAALAAVAVFMTVGAAYAVPLVTDVVMTQRAGSLIVDISYELSGEAAIVTLGIETNGIAIPGAAVTRLTGDVCKKVEVGSHTITWNAGADWPENLTQVAKAKVTAWSVDAPPQVMVIDLSKGMAATKEDPYPVMYYNSLEALPGGGLSNAIYQTVMLVMNKIPSGVYEMGDERTAGVSVAVTLTSDFYTSVYQVTQKQWHKIIGTDPSTFKGPSDPVQNVSYNEIRGATNSVPTINWPVTGVAVAPSSFIGVLRTKTGLEGFDLPTDAQWEYACRARTTTSYNDGINGSTTNQLNELGWWKGNSGGRTHPVGQKTPNAWGLYDMHGNVWEWCLDWYATSLNGGDDPKGAESGTDRLIRSASWSDDYTRCTSRERFRRAPTDKASYYGFRLVRNLP